MKRIQIPTHIIRNPLISHHAIYLYTILKPMINTNTLIITAYTTTILDKAKWNDRRTLKKYLQELKQKELISYDFTNFPINKPLQIEILPIPSGEHFTQVDTDTIQRIIDVCSNISVQDKNNPSKHNSIDLKEMAIRLFYLYESYYNYNFNYAFPSYLQINQDTNISNIYIKILNQTFDKNKLVIVNYGERINNERKINNTYIPICNRVKPKEENSN
jgi:hypothetical protein